MAAGEQLQLNLPQTPAQARQAPKPSTDEEFFRGKRPWSRIKDTTVGNYLVPYLRKIQTRRTPIELIDGCAGPGEYGDGTIGSPLIFVQTAESCAPGRYRAFLVNKNAEQHQALQLTIARRRMGPHVTVQRGGCQDLLRQRGAQLLSSDTTVFVFLDPFGMQPLEMDSLADFFRRPSTASTELLVNLNTPEIRRLAARNRPGDQSRLTTALGGTWWRAIAGHRGQPSAYADGYCRELRRRGFRFAGTCPVHHGKGLKYHLVFATNHIDGMTVMNDVMAGALDHHLPGTRGGHDLLLPDLVLRAASLQQGIERRRLWEGVVVACFARYLEKEFRAAVAELVRAGQLTFESSTGRLNDAARLFAIASAAA